MQCNEEKVCDKENNMKVLFVYPNMEKSVQEHLGIAYLSGILKHNNIETFLWDNTFETIADLKTKVKRINPDFVCLTSLSADFEYATKLAKIIKSIREVPIIIGGPHATFLPNKVISKPCFDVVVRGEGEETLLEYIKTQNQKTKGAWVKDKKKKIIYKNSIRAPPDVNKLPWPDHGMFKKHFRKKVTWVDIGKSNYGIFITSRGCPFRCAYCSSAAYQDLYESNSKVKNKKARYTRFRDIDDVIAEVKYFTKKYNMTHIYFQDETLTIDKQRIIRLCRKYKKEINLPWHAEVRPDTVNKKVLKEMADSGCELIMMGIESGSDRIRNKILKRGISKKSIINAFKWAKEAGIKTSSFNICGIPTETEEEIMQTIKLNKECGADIGKITVCNALPGTELWDFCKKNGCFVEKFPGNYYTDSNIRHERLSQKRIQELRKKFVDAMGGYTGATRKGEF